MVLSTVNFPSRQAYFKNFSDSRFRIQDDSNEWSLSDYKRRVSSTATLEASYEARSSVLPDWGTNCGTASKEAMSETFGLAAGGKMYGARDLTRLLVVSLIS